MDKEEDNAPVATVMEGGEDLDDDFGDNQEGGFGPNDSEDADSANQDEDDDEMGPPKKGSGAKPPAIAPGGPAVKGDKLDNQPYDLAVDVNDSEEIESDEEDDEVNMNDVQQNS